MTPEACSHFFLRCAFIIKYNPTREEIVPNNAFFTVPNFPDQRKPFHGKILTARIKSEIFFNRFQYSSISFSRHCRIEVLVDESLSSLQQQDTHCIIQVFGLQRQSTSHSLESLIYECLWLLVTRDLYAVL